MEIDLVAHCGWSTEGAFLQTLVLTDVATGWTECLPLLYRSQQTVIEALDRARQLLPFPLLALDTDNGKEFINAELLAYCGREQITFTRGRTGKKNDQCFVEQKNGSIVRQLVGYDRFEGEAAYRQLTELYRAVRLYVNFFQPSMKLATKRREGSAVQRTYEAAKTPFRRVAASGVLATATQERLDALAVALDPIQLLRQLRLLQDALWRHAIFRTPAPEVVPDAGSSTIQRFAAESSDAATEPVLAAEQAPRKYRRSAKMSGSRWWRTRADPFAEVWDEVTAWLVADPVRTATSMFLELQQRHPGRCTDVQDRTLQRRVKEWRAQRTLAFDAQWLEAETLGSQRLPRPLRVLNCDQGNEPVLAASPCVGDCHDERSDSAGLACSTNRWFFKKRGWRATPCACPAVIPTWLGARNADNGATLNVPKGRRADVAVAAAVRLLVSAVGSSRHRRGRDPPTRQHERQFWRRIEPYR
ncbi:MAG: DDE-type integrase/transposase/recombinase [Chloroflexota bacterium]